MLQSAIQPLIAKVGIVETRIAQVETAFTDRMKEQVNLLTAITNTQSQHSTDLANLQNKDKANQEAFQDIRQRRENLETQATSLRANFTTAEKMQPDLIMGGWADDQEAATTMHLATEACNNLHLDIDMQEAFVPGLRRGYLVTWSSHTSPKSVRMRVPCFPDSPRQSSKSSKPTKPQGP